MMKKIIVGFIGLILFDRKRTGCKLGAGRDRQGS